MPFRTLALALTAPWDISNLFMKGTKETKDSYLKSQIRP